MLATKFVHKCVKNENIPIRINNSDDNGRAGKTVNWFKGENDSHIFKIVKPQAMLELLCFKNLSALEKKEEVYCFREAGKLCRL